MNILITGKPGIGKTTLIKKIVENTSLPKGGFYTEEIRTAGKRTGFILKTFDGREATLASVNIKSPYRVGKYGVDIDNLEKVGVDSLKKVIKKDTLVVIDEIGKMELYSRSFRDIVLRAIERGNVLATVKLGKVGFADRLKKRKDIKLIELNIENRDYLPDKIIEMLHKK